MENMSYIGLSRQMALRRQMDIIANNLANIDSNAYKRQSVLFQEYLFDKDLGKPMSFVLDYGVARDLSPGKTQATGNPMDLAITGDGYLVVKTEEGERYTKSGRLSIDENGTLVTQTGDPVLDDGGGEISFTEEDGEITIAADGSITTDLGPIGKLNVVAFENEQNLRRVVAGLYRTDDAPIEPQDAEVLQGMLEKSNVQPVLEMTNMINVLRSYQSTQRMLDTEHDLQRRAIDRLGRTG